MENIDYSCYTDQELRQLLRALVLTLSDSQAGEVIKEIKR